MQQKENTIRDYLVDCLGLIESGLEFLEKEKYLPNDLGTKGFVDILAKDSLGRFVIIELKRSNSASREAIHEVLKYIEGVKQNKRLRDDEIRAIIVSTEWDELLVPYSSFCNRCDCSVTAIKLNIDNNLKPISTSKITPLKLNNDRLLSDQHIYRLYTSEGTLDKGIKSHIECFGAKNINDYILVILKAPSGFREQEIEATRQGLEDIDKQFGSSKPSISRQKLEELIPDYKFMIYSVIQVLDESEYMRIISMDKCLAEEVNDFIEDMDSEELLQVLHENALAAKPTPYYEYIGISYPAKFSVFLDGQGWEIERIEKFGGFLHNELLTDEMIITEIRGSSGTNKQEYKKVFNSSSKSSFSQMKKDVKICLQDNPIWRQHILNFIDEAEIFSEQHIFNGTLNVFNFSNTVYALHLTTTSGNHFAWQPNYYLMIESDERKSMYFGGLFSNGKTASMKTILETFYGDDVSQFLFPLTWGGYERRDYKIASFLGLEYTSFKCIEDERGKSFFKYDGYEFHECEPINPFAGFIEYIENNSEFVQEINDLYDKHQAALGLWCT